MTDSGSSNGNDSVAVGSDHYGFPLKDKVVDFLKREGYEYEDYGVGSAEEEVDYPDIAEQVARAVAEGDHERGIIVCGTGTGVAIAANKVKGIRATPVNDIYQAERSRKSNNAQVMTMGAQVTGYKLAEKLVHVWMNSEFSGGRSTRKVDKLRALDEKNFK